jgi:transposase, IS5 family
MSLADSLVQTPRGGILDEVEAVVDWAPLRALLVKRGGGAPDTYHWSVRNFRC